MGHALVVREATAATGEPPRPRMQYRSEFLHAFMDTERLKSHKPVELQRGEDRFTADRMEVLLAQHLFSPPPQLPAQHSDMQDLLNRMMHKDPALRMGTAQEVVKYITERWPLASSARI